jgi:NTP pyrophosphatase (non-canonical NTP hydrolase)
VFTEDDKTEIAKEIGDVLWYLAILAEQLGASLDEVAVLNLR